nr:PREDICTED: LOW QUALITY PROTEIN: sialic acid synthase [Latimeria chalumnae]|eukprot:XP_014351316.1 PREDICTED: LOW QUALITY PROTEIN: sialic acid synthase [Latimeria chalumnae]
MPLELELCPGRMIGGDHPCFIIAEIGQNHQGDIKIAKEMIRKVKNKTRRSLQGSNTVSNVRPRFPPLTSMSVASSAWARIIDPGTVNSAEPWGLGRLGTGNSDSETSLEGILQVHLLRGAPDIAPSPKRIERIQTRETVSRVQAASGSRHRDSPRRETPQSLGLGPLIQELLSRLEYLEPGPRTSPVPPPVPGPSRPNPQPALSSDEDSLEGGGELGSSFHGETSDPFCSPPDPDLSPSARSNVPAQDASFRALLEKVATVLSFELEFPPEDHSRFVQMLWGHSAKSRLQVPLHEIITMVLGEACRAPSSVGPTNKRADRRYLVPDQEGPPLMLHPSTESTVASAASDQARTHWVFSSALPDHEARKWDALGKRVYSTASLGVRVSSYMAHFSQYDHELWSEVAILAKLLPQHKREDACRLAADGLKLSKALMQGAWDLGDTTARGVAEGVSIRRLAWLKGSGFSAEVECRSDGLLRIHKRVGGSYLAQLRLVKRFLKGLLLSKPPLRKPLAQWDINLVLSRLMLLPFEPAESVDLKLLSWKTLFLIAITSAQRICELQALVIHEPFTRFLRDKRISCLMTICSFYTYSSDLQIKGKRKLFTVKISWFVSQMAVEFLHQLNVPFFKVGSGDTNNFTYLERTAQKGRPMVISSGMQSMETMRRVYQTVKPLNPNFCILQCTSAYPLEPEDVNLRIITFMFHVFVLQLGKSVVAKVAICTGTVLTADMFTVKVADPKGIAPEDLFQLVGKKATADIGGDESVTEDAVENHGKKGKC